MIKNQLQTSSLGIYKSKHTTSILFNQGLGKFNYILCLKIKNNKQTKVITAGHLSLCLGFACLVAFDKFSKTSSVPQKNIIQQTDNRFENFSKIIENETIPPFNILLLPVVRALIYTILFSNLITACYQFTSIRSKQEIQDQNKKIKNFSVLKSQDMQKNSIFRLEFLLPGRNNRSVISMEKLDEIVKQSNCEREDVIACLENTRGRIILIAANARTFSTFICVSTTIYKLISREQLFYSIQYFLVKTYFIPKQVADILSCFICVFVVIKFVQKVSVIIQESLRKYEKLFSILLFIDVFIKILILVYNVCKISVQVIKIYLF